MTSYTMMSEWVGLFLVTGLWITLTVAGLTVLRWVLGETRARAGAVATGTRSKRPRDA